MRPARRCSGDYVAAAFRMIFAQLNAEDVHAAWDKTRDELATRFPKLGPVMDTAKAEVLPSPSSPASTGARSGPPTPWGG